MSLGPELPVLSSIEQRVLGSLIEKSRTTPDYYPMSLNGLTAACNQKTSRHPVSDYSEAEVQEALNGLKAQSLVATAVGSGSRTLKYKHNFTTVFEMEPEELAVLCLLMLRGPQTPGEINTNASRLYEFKSLEHVWSTITKLREGQTPFVVELPKRAGQKEARFAHLLGGEVQIDESFDSMPRRSNSDLEARVTALENEVAELKEIIRQMNLSDE